MTAVSTTIRFQSPFWLAMAICLGINAIVLGGAMIGHREHLADYRTNPNPDARHYVLEGRNTFLYGAFSRCSSEPFTPDMLRTPIYPLFAGGLDILLGPVGIYIVQAGFQILGCGLVYSLAARMIHPTAGGVAALLYATDLMVAVSNFEAMSESLFTFLVLLGIWVLFSKWTVGGFPSPGRSAAGGAILAAATLARPAGLYLPWVIVVAIVGQAWQIRRTHRGLVSVVALLIAYSVPLIAWIVRNECTFGSARLTTNAPIMTVYFAGGGAYALEHGITLDEAQSRISAEFKLPPPTITNNPWLSDMPVAEIDNRLRATQSQVLFKYPASLAKSSFLGVFKAHVSHNVATLGLMWGIPWNAAGVLANGERSRAATLVGNHPLLLAALAWQLAHTLVVWLLFGFGVFTIFRRRLINWPLTAVLGAIVYFQLTVALVGMDAYCRSRTPHMPLVAVIAGAGLMKLRHRSSKGVASDNH